MKTGVATLKKKADKYFSLYVRHRDSTDGMAECITCGTKKPIKQMQAGHFVSRRVNALRFDEENVNAQCTGCNMFKAGEQYLYAKALDLKYGDGKAEELMNRRHETHKFTIQELEEIIADAKTQIKFYEEHL
jgi:5-methylcytosine-specific restriction endonuclease McrA